MRRNVAVAALLAVLGAVHMGGWLDPDLLPPYDFAGYVTVAEDVRNQMLRHGEVPDWNPKWFAGSTQHVSHLKERLMLPAVTLFGGLRGVELCTYLLKLAAGLLFYAGFARYLGAPGAGLVCGYAYAFSTFSSYSTQKVDVAFSAVLFPLIFAAALEMFRRRSARFAIALGILVACEFSMNLTHALLVPVAVILLALLRPWPRGSAEAERVRDRLSPRQLALRWSALTSLALAVFALFAASQIAWFVADQKHHAPHDPEYVARAIHHYAEQTPLALINRGDFLDTWLTERGVQRLERSPEDPLRGQRRYLGCVALAVCLGGWFAARRDRTLRRAYQFFALLFFVQWNLAGGPTSLAVQLTRSLGVSESTGSGIGAGLGVAALGCLAWAAVRWAVERRRWTRRLELPLALGLFCALVSLPIFSLLRTALPFFAHFRSPGTYMALIPFCFYALFGLGLVAIARRLPRGRATHAFLGAALALCILDFWSGRLAFTRGTSVAPIREFRARLAQLPGGDAEGRLAMSAFDVPTLWNDSSLAIVDAPLDSSWGWLTWQAGPHALPFQQLSFMWLRDDIEPRQRVSYRRMGNVLGEVGRYRYLLEEFRELPGVDFGPPWRRVATNERFALWERPVVLPMAYAYRAYAVTLGSQPVYEAFAIYNGHPLGVATIAASASGERAPEDLLAESVLVIQLGEPEPGAAVPPPPAAERFADKFVDLRAPDFRARLRRAYAERSAQQWLPATFRRLATDHLQLEVDAGAEPAVVVVSEAHHPWWRVEVDGTAAPLLRANMLFMGVRVGPGRHRIDLRLRRPLAVAGADTVTGASWAALLIAGGARAVRRLRRRRVPI
ncbi:MAG TPA: hypothetical protein VIY27_13130 [Myxococcota bacterium]